MHPFASISIEKVENYFNGQRIYLLDRGYWQMELYSKILSMGHSIVARVRNHMTKKLKYGSPAATITSVAQRYTLRVVRLLLPSGKTETLVTNLSSHEFSDQDIAQLYSLRWGVETAYDTLKNLLAMNNISSKTQLTVYQDFYAILAIFNLAAFASYVADSQIPSLRADKHNKYQYKASRFSILAVLKPALPLLLYTHSAYRRRKLLRYIFAAFSARPVPVRNNRPTDRSRTILKYKNHPPIAVGLNPYAYMLQLLTELPYLDRNPSHDDLDMFLPWKPAVRAACTSFPSPKSSGDLC